MSVSMSGLELPWLKKDRGCKPGRYAFDADKGIVPASQKRAERARAAAERRGTVALPMFVPDVDAAYGGSWKSVIDGSEISSRSNWREHNKRNAVVDVGDRFWSEDGDDIKRTEELMGYDPSLIGHPDFHWGKDSTPSE